MLVSTWFNALDGKGWQYMATVRKRNSSTYFSSWYSFLENYVWANGQASRKAYYRNGYGRSRTTGKWYNFNSVGFGHTDGGSEAGARADYGQGATDKASDRTFFMQSGGYTSTKQTASTVALATDNTVVDTIDIAPLDLRVRQAIQKEIDRATEGDVKDFVLSPMTSVNGVSVEGEIPADAVRYNISGQRVGQGAHGVIIVNGKKYIAK